MSGGHYDYAFYKVREMADQLEEDIKEKGHPRGYNAHLRRKVVVFLRETADMMRALEWEDSGDGGDWQSRAQDLLAGRWD